MIRIENHCVGCEVCGSCGARTTVVKYCDCCHEEVYHLNQFDEQLVDEQLCDDCLEKMIKEDFIDDILLNFSAEIREYLGISEVI